MPIEKFAFCGHGETRHIITNDTYDEILRWNDMAQVKKVGNGNNLKHT